MNPRFTPIRPRFSPVALRALLPGAVALALQTVSAAPSPSDSSPSSSAYTNQPTSTSTTTYYDSGFSSSSFGDGFSRFGGTSTITRYYDLPTIFYFPPTPPALGEPVTRRRTSGWISNFSSKVTPIQPQLAPYVGENFYPPLATHLHLEDLSRRQHQRLEEYRTTRDTLLSSLHAKLDSLNDADNAARERELSNFAREQGPQIDALEQEAEAIRNDLVQGSFFHFGVDWDTWDANRSWRLGDDLRYESRVDEYKVIRAAAYFYPGTSPAQRRLLEEFAMELNEPLTEPGTDTALNAPNPYFFFSPSTARTRLPQNLPDDLANKIAAYQKEKSALKEELRGVIYKLDRAFFSFSRRTAMKALADQQASRLAALEAQEEEIRRGLVNVANPNRPKRSSVPSELGARISAYNRDRQALLRALQDKITETKKQFPTARVEPTRVGEGYGVLLVASRRQSNAEAERLPAYQASLATFNDEQVKSYNALQKTKGALLADVVKLAGANGTSATPQSVDLMLRKFAVEIQQHETWDLYRDYDYAVYEPGLSASQRRLLYNASLVKLDLPLPSGSRQP